MSFYHLDESGYFYANKSIVKVSKKPAGVNRYIIYKSAENPIIIPVKTKFYDMKNGELLEIVTESFERIFFFYNGKEFERKNFAKIDTMEGEYELLRHLGLIGLNRVKHHDESPIA